MGVPEACAVHVQGQAVLGGQRPHGVELVGRLHRPAAEVVGVLDLDGHRRDLVGPGVRVDQLGDGAGRQQAALRLPGAEGDAGEHGGRTQFGAGDVGQAVADDLLARSHQQAQAELVGHRPGRAVEARLEPEQLGDLGLERVEFRVLAVDVVADLGLRHGLAHRRRRSRDRVAAEVDRSHELDSERRRSATRRSATRNASSRLCSMFRRGSQAVS